MPTQATIEQRKKRQQQRNKNPKVGDVRADGKVYSGENYGYQSKATHDKLKKAGKFRAGTQALDRATSSAKRALKKYTPEPAKRAARSYSRRLAESQERQRQGEELMLQRGGIGAQYIEAKRGADGRRAQDVEFLSRKLNVDPRIVDTAITAVQTAAEGRLSKQQLTTGVRNYVKQLPADKAFAYNAPKPGAGSKPLPKQNRPYTGSQSSASKAREARAKGRAVSQPDGRFTEKDLAPLRTTPSNRVDRAGKRTQFEQTNAKGSKVNVNPDDLSRQSRARSDRARQAGRVQRQTVDQPPRAQRKPTPKEQQRVDQFFSGNKTAETFSSKKGSDRDVPRRQAELADAAFERARESVDGGFDTRRNPGYYIGENPVVRPGTAGKPGAIRSLGESIQKERIRQGQKPLSKSQLAEAVNDRILAYRFPEQFNQLQAERAGFRELPTPREARKGQRSKSAADRKRPENIPGGERIEQSQAERARRAAQRSKIAKSRAAANDSRINDGGVNFKDKNKPNVRRAQQVPQPDPRRQQRNSPRVMGTDDPGKPQGSIRKPSRSKRVEDSNPYDLEVETGTDQFSRQSDESRPMVERLRRQVNRAKGGAKRGAGSVKGRGGRSSLADRASDGSRPFRADGELRGVTTKNGAMSFMGAKPEPKKRSAKSSRQAAETLRQIRARRRRRSGS